MSQTKVLKLGAVPKYSQLEAELRARAAALGPGEPIESERSLMETYGVSRATVRRAIADLVNDGVLVSLAGQGTFVAEAKVQTNLHLASFTQDMTQRGRVPSTAVLSMRLAEPDARAAEYFGTGAPAWHLERVRCADGEPMALEDQWIDPRIAPDLGTKDLRGSTYAIFAEDYDAPVDAAEQTMWATTADERLAEILDIEVGQAVLVFDRWSSSRGRPVESVRSWYRADRYRVHMSLDTSMRA
ncbi:GntR family transcriptional regulator [Raineyella fluvialis]|uniref:UTRA domain-containing protein n=1 Tax=Raineyella fluvialis TaxID=2662261 RepID=A0A5Q2F962_9ACTN|nr:GntR family transcriptional regulator [Raineyella fluvialis]QGF23442.1 UTRA domain-containing protein [Raineyella fluvialis]